MFVTIIAIKLRVVMKEKKHQKQQRRRFVRTFLRSIEIPRRERRKEKFIEKSREESMRIKTSRVKVLRGCYHSCEHSIFMYNTSNHRETNSSESFRVWEVLKEVRSEG